MSPRRLTWAQVARAVDGVATELLRAGLRDGDVVGVQLPNIAELAIVYLAGMRLGVIISPFPAQYREHEVVAMGNIGQLRRPDHRRAGRRPRQRGQPRRPARRDPLAAGGARVR